MTLERGTGDPHSQLVAEPRTRLLRYAYMKLARELDARFENLLLTGRVSKWYSEVGNEATTVAAGMALEAGDSLCTLHRDLGAILPVYLDPARTFKGFDFGAPDAAVAVRQGAREESSAGQGQDSGSGSRTARLVAAGIGSLA